MNSLDIRTKKYSMTEFKALARDRAGNIIDLYEHFLLLTPAQVYLLSEDDSSYYYELQDELNCELFALCEEFGC